MSNVAWKTTRMAISLSSLFDTWLISIAKRCSALLRGIKCLLELSKSLFRCLFQSRRKVVQVDEIRRCLATFSNFNKPFTQFQEGTPPQSKVCSWRPSLAGAIQDKQYLFFNFMVISIGNSMISSDIWHKYHEWYFKIVIRNFTIR